MLNEKKVLSVQLQASSQCIRVFVSLNYYDRVIRFVLVPKYEFGRIANYICQGY